ncbi:hypothetical protein ACFE04_023694 [Oxalis oulophora]
MRSPCCENNMGMKKGPWTPQEDHILISYVQQFGHSNWRALPKQAGLLRCGKSCRLRWRNYLRPDIKRGNFSNEEDEFIIKLHQSLGNKWSTIAASLPGRTDNEIKNYWHTHLKKRLKHQPSSCDDNKSTHVLLKPEIIGMKISDNRAADQSNTSSVVGPRSAQQFDVNYSAAGAEDFWLQMLMKTENSMDMHENIG